MQHCIGLENKCWRLSPQTPVVLGGLLLYNGGMTVQPSAGTSGRAPGEGYGGEALSS